VTLRLETLTPGPTLDRLLEALAELRIEVFRDWPYLYDGSRDFEARYLARFATAAGSVLVAAFDGEHLVGACTGLPLADEHPELAEPFRAADHDLRRLFYGAETVLRRPWRGRGLYRRFFERREAHARTLGFGTLVFCGVARPDHHPLRPSDAVPLDPVWTRYGYRRLEGMVAGFSWKDVDQGAETTKPMQFWGKPLA